MSGFVVPKLTTSRRFDKMRDYQDIRGDGNLLTYFGSLKHPLLWIISQMYPDDVCVIEEPFLFDRSCVFRAPASAEKSLRECVKRFSICNLDLYCGMDGNHANSLIFDRSTGSLTRFEPHGVKTEMSRGGKYALKPEEMVTKSGIAYDKIDIELEKWMRQQVGDLFTVYYRVEKQTQHGGSVKQGDMFSIEHRNEGYPVDFSDLYGNGEKCAFKELGGYCTTFSLMLLHLRIANPDKTVEEIVDHMRSYGAKSLEETSKMYMNYMAFELAEPDHVAPACHEVADALKGKRYLLISEEGQARVGDAKIYFTDSGADGLYAEILSVNNNGCKMDVRGKDGRRLTLRFVVGDCGKIARAVETTPPVRIVLSGDSFSIPLLDMRGKLRHVYNHQNQTATIISVKPRCDVKRAVVKVAYADGHEGNITLITK